MAKFVFDFVLVARRDGYSAPSTHPGQDHSPSMTNTHALIHMVKKFAVRSDKARHIPFTQEETMLTTLKGVFFCCARIFPTRTAFFSKLHVLTLCRREVLVCQRSRLCVLLAFISKPV